MINRLGLRDEAKLAEAERELTFLAASQIEFNPPPYGLAYFQGLHLQLFSELFDWAGKLRTIDISKGETRFCHVDRIEIEAEKYFRQLSELNWFEGLDRATLVKQTAIFYGDINVIHPFREGNGRAQRLLFEHLIINAGFQIDWWQVDAETWLRANISAVTCDYRPLIAIFEACIGDEIPH